MKILAIAVATVIIACFEGSGVDAKLRKKKATPFEVSSLTNEVHHSNNEQKHAGDGSFWNRYLEKAHFINNEEDSKPSMRARKISKKDEEELEQGLEDYWGEFFEDDGKDDLNEEAAEFWFREMQQSDSQHRLLSMSI